jgi:hypothetical protein
MKPATLDRRGVSCARAGRAQRCSVQFTDLHGVAKGKLVPLAHLD